MGPGNPPHIGPLLGWLMSDLRPSDRLELQACGYRTPAEVADRFNGVLLGAIYSYEAEPVAVVAFAPLTPSTVSAALLASRKWRHVAPMMVRHGLRTLRPMLLTMGFRRAECRTIVGHDDAVRLLERVGFVLECRVPLYGKEGETFLQYAWRLSDHKNEGLHVHLPETAEN